MLLNCTALTAFQCVHRRVKRFHADMRKAYATLRKGPRTGFLEQPDKTRVPRFRARQVRMRGAAKKTYWEDTSFRCNEADGPVPPKYRCVGFVRLLLIIVGAALRFNAAVSLLGIQSPFAAARGRARLAPDLRFFHRGFDKRAQFFHAGHAIGVLRSLGIGHDQQIAIDGHAILLRGLEPMDSRAGHANQRFRAHAQFRLRIDLVDILPARPAGARKMQTQIVRPCTHARRNGD